MPLPRTLLLTLAFSLLGLLTACVNPPSAAPVTAGEAPASLPAQLATASPGATPSLAPQPPVASGEAVSSDPIIIRGNDRVLAPSTAGPGTLKGPASSFNFQDAPSAEVAQVMLRDLLKVEYVVHPPLPGTITLVTRNEISADKAFNLLESALQINGIVMARDARGTYHVGTPQALSTIVAAPRQAGAGPLPPGYGAIVVPLEFLGAQEMANILQPMIRPDAIVRVDSLRNVLIMRGTRAEAEGWLDMVKTFDINLLRGMSVGVFPLKHISPAEMQAALQMLSGAMPGAAPAAAVAGRAAPVAPGRTAAAPAAPAAGAQAAAAIGANAFGQGSPLFGALRVMPIERINAVLVVTPRSAYLDEVRYWIEQFDRPNLGSAEPQLFVYKVQNGSADHLAELLNGIYGGSMQTATGTGATGVAPGLTQITGVSSNLGGRLGTGSTARRSGFGTGATSTPFGSAGTTLGGIRSQQQQQAGGPAITTVALGDSVRVMADRINNSLLIHATPAEFERIQSTLKRLDVTRAQILIEASIVEVTLGDGLEYGLEWAFRDGGLGGGRSGVGGLNNSSTERLISGPSFDPATGALTGLAQGFSYAVRAAGGNIGAVLRTVASQSQIKVISSPSLMVLDNHTAAIAVGNQQPVRIGDTTTTGTVVVTNNIQYKDTGVMLDVTPSVNAGDLVTLDINQAVTDVGPVDSVTSQRTFLQRQINSKVAVRSGETLVLGGLIKDNTTNSKSGLPVLSAIPVIGGLFGRHVSNNDRTELLVVLTPRVVRSDEDVRAVSRELRDRMKGLVSIDAPAVTPSRSR